MIKSNYYWVTIFAISQLFFLLPVSAAANNSAGQSLLLLYSNDVKGETEACG